MTKLSRRPISSEKLGQYINNLWSAFTLMDSKEDIRLLFRSLFTHTEYKMFAKRLEIARRLIRGDHYDLIMKTLNVSDKTISHISNILAEKGEGFIKADQKLGEIDRKLLKRQQERQDRLERRARPRMPGEDVLPELVKLGVSALGKQVKKSLRQASARRTLNS